MLSDFPASDLSDDACSVIYLFLLNSCRGVSSASSISIIKGTTVFGLHRFGTATSPVVCEQK